MNLLGNTANEEQFVSEFKDPFNKECIEEVWLLIQKESGKIIFKARIKFINGNTRGEQWIHAGDFIALVKKTEDFIQSFK